MLDLDHRPTEAERVEAWRLEVLIEAGYSMSLADHLARATHVDLHRAVDLLKDGCKPSVAALILI